MKYYALLTGMMMLLAGPLQAQYKTELYVAKDGSAEFTSIQAAIDATKAFPDERIRIYIKNGLYEEKVKVYSWNDQLSLIGESADKTIIRWSDYFDKIDKGRNSTFHTPTLLVQGDAFYAENLTIKNAAGEVGQAVAVAVETDRAVFNNCRFLGNQDTLYAAGSNARQYYKNCYIEGTTDFIFGQATALFDNCTIHSKSNSYITAASTPGNRDFGFVFLRCKLTAETDVNRVYLGRPWRKYAKTVFLYCKMGGHILPEGWDNWSSPEREKTTLYAEYGNTGAGADTSGRVGWSHQLTEPEARKYNLENILNPFLLPEMTIDF